MKKCSSCNATLSDDDLVCPYCGNNLGKGGKTNKNEKISLNENDVLFSLLCYIGILFIIPFFFEKRSEFLKFHMNQGIVLFISNAVLFGALSIMFFNYLIWMALSAIFLAFSIYGIYNSITKQMKRLPLIGKIEIYH